MSTATSFKSQIQDETLAATRRHQIFLAACRVLARKSFHEATVKEIALEAGIAAGSIYVYLKSKDDILFLIAESMVSELVEVLPAIHAAHAEDPRRELLAVMRAVLDVIDRYRDAFAVLDHEVHYLLRKSEYRDANKQVAERYFAAVGDVLVRGREAGVIQYDDLRSMVQVIHMLCAGWARSRRIAKETYWNEISSLVEGRLFAPRRGSSAAGQHSLRE